MLLLRPKVSSMNRPQSFYEKREVFIFLEKYIEENNLYGTRIFNADNISISTV